MASRTSPSGGDYDLSDPVGGFADVVRRVVLQPQPFFAGLPRQGGLLGPLVFAREARVAIGDEIGESLELRTQEFLTGRANGGWRHSHRLVEPGQAFAQ